MTPLVQLQKSYFRRLFSGLQRKSPTLSVPSWVGHSIIFYLNPYLFLEDLPPLAQRQERRVVSPISSTNTVESWDFATTINSPLASIYKRRFLEDLFTDDGKESLNISPLAKEPSASDVPPSEQAKRETNDPSALSFSTSNSSSVPSSITTPSASSLLLHTTPPSSYTESTGPPCGVPEKSFPKFRTGPEPPVSIAEITIQHTTPGTSEPTLPAPSPRAPSRQVIPSSPIVSTSQQGLWRKIKNNVRVSSRGDDEGLDSNPRKGRGKISGIFTSASMLSKQSSRSLIDGMPTIFNFQERKHWCADPFF